VVIAAVFSGMKWRFSVKVGDLVKHKQGGWTGMIVRVENAEGGHDPLFHIKWTDQYRGACWSEEIEIISESR
jgi:hypothetical protein